MEEVEGNVSAGMSREHFEQHRRDSVAGIERQQLAGKPVASFGRVQDEVEAVPAEIERVGRPQGVAKLVDKGLKVELHALAAFGCAFVQGMHANELDLVGGEHPRRQVRCARHPQACDPRLVSREHRGDCRKHGLLIDRRREPEFDRHAPDVPGAESPEANVWLWHLGGGLVQGQRH